MDPQNPSPAGRLRPLAPSEVVRPARDFHSLPDPCFPDCWPRIEACLRFATHDTRGAENSVDRWREVESWAQLALLREDGCEAAQGFLFSEPLPPDAFEKLLRDWGCA